MQFTIQRINHGCPNAADRHSPVSNGNGASSVPSAEIYLTDVDVDHQHIQDRSTVRTSGIGAPTSRKPYAASFAVLRCQLRGRKATGDVDLVVMSAKQQVVTEKEVLNEAVSLDRPRKVRTQDAPRVWPLLPRLDPFNSDVAQP
jgi:hypothetical protein